MGNRNKFQITLSILWLLSGLHTAASERFSYRFEVISMGEGLAQHDVTSVVQDRFGLIWIATYNGLHRYDGYNSKVFRYNSTDLNSLSDNRVLCMLVDSGSRLWAGTEGGGLNLYNYDNESFTSFRIGQTPLDNNIYSIYEDNAGDLWLGASNGLYRARHDGKKGLSVEKIERQGISIDNVRIVCSDEFGDIFVGTTTGTCILEHKGDGVYGEFVVIAGTLGQQVTTICREERGNMWIGTLEGLFLYNHSNRSLTAVRDRGHSFSNVRFVVRKGQDTFLMATESSGIYELVKDSTGYSISKMDFDDERLFGSAIVRNLFIDHMRNLWIGTGNTGVVRVDLLAKRFYRLMNGPNDGSSFVRAFLKDSKGRLWVQTRQKKLEVFEKNHLTETYVKLSAPDIDRQIISMLEDRRGNIWLVCDSDIYKIAEGSPPNVCVSVIDKPPYPKRLSGTTTFHSIGEDYAGNIWIGCWNGALRISPPNNKNHVDGYKFFSDFGLPGQSVNVVQIFCEPNLPRIWFCSRDFGLFMADLDEDGNMVSTVQFHVAAGEGKRLNSNHVWSVRKSPDGTVWVGTDAGLNSISFDGETPQTRAYRGVERLDDDKILAVTDDTEGRLWLSTSVGLLSFDPRSGDLYKYYYRDGLSSNGLTERCFLDDDGTIYLGSINGITFFRPSEIMANPYPPTVAVNRLSIFNREVGVGGKINGRVLLTRSIFETSAITLRHNQNNFTFEFIAMHFNNPERNIYSHMLEGYDKDWITTDGRHRTASYNSLPPGKYMFRVRAANSDGIWNPDERVIAVEVKAAPWSTWWAYAVYLLTGTAIVFFILRHYQQQQQLRNKLYIEQLEHLHDREMNEARVKFHNNITHELRTPLTLILAPLRELLTHEINDEYVISRLRLMEKNTDRLTGLVNQFLDLRKLDKESMPLKVRKIDVLSVVFSIVDDFRHYARQRKINLSLISETPSVEGWADSEKLTKIISNLLSNALKFTPEGGNVTVIAARHEENLSISVEDTGCGIAPEHLPYVFDRFYQCGNSDATGTGIGLALVRMLAGLHHGEVSAISTPGCGSTFTLLLPVSSGAFSADEIADEPELTDGAGSFEKESTDAIPGEKPIILVIDDDDDMRRYLGECLSPTFEVVLEDNAVSGQHAALKYIPDLIITDVMMPGMTGFELSGMLKSDFRTSHIPIIILTAKYSDEDMLHGYRTGAENYITKPFNKEQLLLKVKNIVRFRRMSARGGRVDEDRNAVVLNEREQKFLDKLTAIVNANLDRTDYSVEEICREIGTSRMQLHRKLTALIGKTASEFIRDIRMRRAKELLESGNFNVSEAIYQTGFKSNSHFSKTFKETYGITPSEFIRKRQSWKN